MLASVTPPSVSTESDEGVETETEVVGQAAPAAAAEADDSASEGGE